MKKKRISSRPYMRRRGSLPRQEREGTSSDRLSGAVGALAGTIFGVLIAHWLAVDHSSRTEKREVAVGIVELAESRLQLSRFVFINCDVEGEAQQRIFIEKWDEYMKDGVRLWSGKRISNKRLLERYFPDAIVEFEGLDRDFRSAHRRSYHEAFMDILRREGAVTRCVYETFEQDIYSNEAKLKLFADKLFSQL